MLQRCLVFILSVMLCALPVGAADHVVGPRTVENTLVAAARARRQNLAAVENVLSGPAAMRAAASAGIDLGKVRGGLPSLSDRELGDLATRAASLRANPAAGHYRGDDVETLLVVMILIAFVAVAVVAANHY